MRSLCASLVAAFALAVPALAQSAVGWRAYPAFNEASAVTAAPDGVWAASDGGVFFYGIPDGELRAVTTVDGLQGGRVGALAFDAERGRLWIGYDSGVLDWLDVASGGITSLYAISRADQYAARGIRRFRFQAGALYVATDFGLVTLDPETGAVRSSYTRLGALQAGTPVNDMIVAALPDGSDGLWVATDGGVLRAPLAAENLQTPSAWIREAFDGPGFSLAQFKGRLYLGGGRNGARDLYLRTSEGRWERQLYIDNQILSLAPGEAALYAVSLFASYAVPAPGQAATVYRSPAALSVRDVAVGPDGRAWGVDAASGLFSFPLPGAGGILTFDVATVAPPGPLSNNIVDLDVDDDGVVWAMTARLESSGYAAVSRLAEGVWTSFRTDDPDLDISRATFRGGGVSPEGVLFAGTDGAGVSVFSGDDVMAYNETNSTLAAPTGTSGYVVVLDAAFEDDLAWVLNVSDHPLQSFDGQTWRALPFPAGIPTSVTLFRIAIDDFGQKWLALHKGGLAVWNTGDDPFSAPDDRGIRFVGSPRSGMGLPNDDVRDVVVDREGRVWIGTARGLAYVFSPGSAFAGSADLATPQWPILADGSDWLLRDVEVNDLDVDPAGQIWVGTSSGAYLVAATGDAVVRTITAENSPLPSDKVLAVSVDPGTGRVYFVTEEGLFSAPGDATRPRGGSDELVTSPSPYRPAMGNEGVVVSGLGSAQSQVRVMTAAGDVVYAADVQGGSFRWNGRDQSGLPVPSGVYLVAAAGADGVTRFGKVAVIR